MNPALLLLRGLAAGVAVVLAGCATPDLKPFSEQTAALATAVSGEQRQISTKYEQVIDLYDQACSKERKRATLRGAGGGEPSECRHFRERTADAKTFGMVREVVATILGKSVLYATRLTELASAGETGSAAAQSLIGSLQQLGSIGGFATAIPVAGMKVALDKIATAVTRIQAQNSLAEATAKADVAIQAIADGVVEIRTLEATLVNTLYQDEIGLAVTLAGEDLVRLFENAAIEREALSGKVMKHELAKLNGCGPETPLAKRPPGAASACDAMRGDLRGTEELGRLLEQLRPQHEAYTARRAAAARWRAERKDNYAMVGKAAQAWKEEHAKVAQQLERCGGLRAVRCATLDAGTLKTVIDQINEIRSIKEK